MARKDIISETSDRQEVEDFLSQAKGLPVSAPASGPSQGRLIFAMDATASRQPSWDRAAEIQAEMFDAVDGVGALDIQLVFFRGLSECKASGWCRNAKSLRNYISKVSCHAGHTQIERVLAHVERESANGKVDALIYVGDCIEENPDHLAPIAGKLALKGVKAFMFQEGYDRDASFAFGEIARITDGAFMQFDASSAKKLRDLLGAVASYAVGGQNGLSDYQKKTGSDDVLKLGHQLRKKS
ncbi:MAG: VWA domain-containing protein [Thalassospira sp.]|uniref:VWA domain-containing protein n=1 Tax=Thalassospira sp. TaxID=1912094 RepID=UPI0032EDF70D